VDQFSQTEEGRGQIPNSLNALGQILHCRPRLDDSEDDDVLHAAINAIAEVAAAVGETRQLELQVVGHQALAPNSCWNRLECQVFHLDSRTLYDIDRDIRYLIDGDGRLLPIQEVRRAREHDHWRVVLMGSKVQIPVHGTAKAYVSDQPFIAGKTLVEVYDNHG